MLFVSFFVASGMNFCYSGQIIALAQYFDKWHSIATSVAMTGIGFGILFLVSVNFLSQLLAIAIAISAMYEYGGFPLWIGRLRFRPLLVVVIYSDSL